MDFLDPVHPRQGQNNAAAGGDASPHVAKTGPARRDRDAVRGGKAQDLGNGGGGARQGHRLGEMTGKPFVAGVLPA